jgi:putative iron-dependent peroxidase
VHDLNYFNGLSLEDQENLFGRTKAKSERLPKQVPTSHLSHVELREGETADDTKAKRGEMVRRSTPYAFHDGTVGLYFMGFCKEQAPLRERMEAIYGMNGQARDALTDYSTPASGSFYFAPSVEVLEAALR